MLFLSDSTKGPDLLNGTPNADLIDADSENDTVNGHRGSDNLFGQDGKDILFGRSGNDKILGNADTDTVVLTDDFRGDAFFLHDFFGSFNKQKNFVKTLLKFCVNHNYNHIELMHYGHEDKFINKTLFRKKNINQKLPYYVEPFDNLKKQHLYFAYKSKLNKKIKIVRADADADRPNKV